MDKITKGNLKSFKEEQSLDINEESILFEHFSNYCVVSKEYNNSFAIDDIHVGSGQDKSIDGIAIIINGNLITSEQEVEDLAKSNKYLDVSFILIQSKTSSTFDTGDIAKFMIGAKEFFDDQNNVPHNSKIQEKAEIMEYVYQASSLFRNRNPNLNLYYVTTGKWVDDSTINGTVSSLKKNLEDLNMFTEINFIPVDAKELQNLYRSSNNRIVKQINFEKYIPLPQIKSVGEAYIGIVSAQEYLKLIMDDSDNIIKGLFYDNVRDFQGDQNDVNEDHNNIMGKMELKRLEL